jgi:tripartite-type tricarboxylate transporter receptor subunit TctC
MNRKCPIELVTQRPIATRRRQLLIYGVGAWLSRSAIAATPDPVEFPNRPIRCILPSTAGGTSDLLGHLVAARLSEVIGQPVVLELRPGAAGRIAADVVARAAPDGYTLLLANNGTNAIVPGGRGMAAVEFSKELAPVTLLARLPIVIVASLALDVRTLRELLVLARESPGKLSFASGGAGSTSHIAATLLFRRAGVRLVHVPYSGTSAAVKDVLSGEVPLMFTHLGTVAGLIAAGQLRALAVTGDHRMGDFPGVETVAETGFAGFDVTTWHGIMVPAGTPRPVVLRLHDALSRIVGRADVQTQLAAMGMEPLGSGPEQFAIELDADVRRWTEVIRTNGIATE